MRDWIILGLVQGLTEFIPVSSTGHLILAREFLGILPSQNDLAIDAILQLATVLAVGVIFRRELWGMVRNIFRLLSRDFVPLKEKTLLFSVLFGSIPAVIIGLLLESRMESTFRSSEVVAYSLLFGSALFILAEKSSQKNSSLTLSRGVGIGFFQALALIPGMSRSGSTISGGLFLGLSREEATRFSFILSFPLLLGTGGIKLIELLSSSSLFSGDFLGLLLSFVIAFLSGLWAIQFLLQFLRTHTLIPFAFYRIFLAGAILFFS